MKKHISLFLAVGMLVAADDPRGIKPDTDNTHKDALQGTWVAVSGENSKEKFDKELKGIRLVVTGDKLTLRFGDDIQKATYKLNPTRKPKAIDISFTAGQAKG